MEVDSINEGRNEKALSNGLITQSFEFGGGGGNMNPLPES